jgi:hypothetical protein
MLWKTAKPFARRGAAAGGVGMLLSGETDFAMAGFGPRLIRQGRRIPENPTAVERAAALGESATKRSADPAVAPAGFDFRASHPPPWPTGEANRNARDAGGARI